MSEQKKGCCWIQYPVMLVVLAYMFLLFQPPHRTKVKAKEAEVKQNLHAIQLVLERYAVDHDGHYPMVIMGGDWTDSYAVSQEFSAEIASSYPDLHSTPPLSNLYLEPAPSSGGDALMKEGHIPIRISIPKYERPIHDSELQRLGYLPRYPQNPFKRVSTTKLPLILKHCNHLGEITSRRVGGYEGNRMVEIFGPPYIQRDQQVSGDLFVHHIFNDPPYDINDMRKENGVDWNKPSGNELLVGNFSFFPRPNYEVDFWLDPVLSGTNEKAEVTGFTLAGYGSIRTSGQDVYNRNGNYNGRYRTEPCNVDCSKRSVFPNDIPCICPGDGDLEPTMYQNNGGSDTLPDGVVLTLDGGRPYRSSKVNFDKTEGS